jgi:nucleotide-binding universal stress UspA family protein
MTDGGFSAQQEGTMYKNILIPTDGSELAGKAVQHGLSLAKTIGAKVTAVTVLKPYHAFTLAMGVAVDTSAAYQKRIQDAAAKTVQAVADQAKALSVACDTVQVEHEHPYQAIIDAAKSKGCDLIVMASHGRSGITALVLGSETLKVLTHTKIPVLVHR